MNHKVLMLLLILAPVFLFLSATQVAAAKKRVWTATTSTARTGGGNFSISASLTGWKQYLNLSFRNVASTQGVTYELIYNGSNTVQGVYGDIKPSEGNASRKIFFGTCSLGVCNPHKNISDVHLTITYKTLDGQSVTKKYKVKY